MVQTPGPSDVDSFSIDLEAITPRDQDRNFDTKGAESDDGIDLTALPRSPTPSSFQHAEDRPQTPEPHANPITTNRPIRTLRGANARKRRLKNASLSRLGFYDRLLKAGVPTLYGQSISKSVVSYEIALSTLQRMVIHDLQQKLVMNVKDIVRTHEVTEESMDTAQEMLSKYSMFFLYNKDHKETLPNGLPIANAIRDYDFMTRKLIETSAIGERDPFWITTKDTLGLYLMKEALLVPKNVPVEAQDREKYKRHENILPGSSRNIHNLKTSASLLWDRLWMGVCGGLALIAPMLIMVLHNDEITSLVTTSVATMLFSLTLAYFGDNLKGQEVLACVAAYAAVLVVFMGTNS